MRSTSLTAIVVTTLALFGMCGKSFAVSLNFVGSQADLDNRNFPGGALPYVTAYWRTDVSNNIYAVDQTPGSRFYGQDGYALFATHFAYPNVNDGITEAFIDPVEGDPLFPNLINLPSWVTDSQILAERMAGGFAYALVDDPQLMTNGIRYWTFDGVNYPLPNPNNVTGQNPYVKIGFLDGLDIYGNNPSNVPAGRWGFTVGEGVPSAFRIGVMTGGGDNANFAPAEVLLQQFDGTTPIGSPASSGTLSGNLRDRFVDMHFFDITNAQPGETFVFGVMAGAGSFGNSGIAGFSFDVLPSVAANADFNSDTKVDGSDYLAWQRGFGITSGASLSQGDADGNGAVNAADLSVWSSQYGTGAAAPVAASVPEPGALALAALTAAWCARRRLR